MWCCYIAIEGLLEPIPTAHHVGEDARKCTLERVIERTDSQPPKPDDAHCTSVIGH